MIEKIKSPVFQFNGHLQSVIPSVFRKVKLNYKRERLELSDGDFVDLDWNLNGGKKLIIVTHGLEGDSTRHYVTGAIKSLEGCGFDGLGWNCRSCSGEINRLPRFYHHGDASDLKTVVEHALTKNYEEIYLVGFSMGGSLTTRYLAENRDSLSETIKEAIVASVPLDLLTSVYELNKKGKRFYQDRFLRKLHVKLKKKEVVFPQHAIINTNNYKEEVKSFEDFDNRYTAPLHGYNDAVDFYTKASVKPLLNLVNRPLTIIQAINDPFLTPECLEINHAKKNPFLRLILTNIGGHVGFMQRGKPMSFVEEFIRNKWGN